jgi:hypothetical protein
VWPRNFPDSVSPRLTSPHKQGWLSDWLANLGEPEVEREDRQDVQHFSVHWIARARQPVSYLEVSRTVVADGILICEKRGLERVRDWSPQIRGGTAWGHLERPRHLSSR